MVRPALTDLNFVKLHYYVFVTILEKCDGSRNTVESLFGWICVPNKIEDVKSKVFNVIYGTNESKTLLKPLSCELISEFYRRKCKSE